MEEMEDQFAVKSIKSEIQIPVDESNSDSNNDDKFESSAKKTRSTKTTGRQFQKIISFVEDYSKRGKKLCSKEWNHLTDQLNAIGPPFHTSDEWRKIWTDKGSRSRKKLATCGVVGNQHDSWIIPGMSIFN